MISAQRDEIALAVCRPVFDASGYWTCGRLMAGDGGLVKAHFMVLS